MTVACDDDEHHNCCWPKPCAIQRNLEKVAAAKREEARADREEGMRRKEKVS